MGKQQVNSGEVAAASTIQFFTKQELLEREYKREVKVNDRAAGYSNPLVTGDLQAALEGRPEALKWGVDKPKALAYFVAVPAGTDGARALRVVGNSFSFAMRDALKELKVPLPKGMIAYMPVEVQTIPDVGVALVVNTKTPRYEDAPPKKVRQSKKNQPKDEQGKPITQQTGAAAANASPAGDVGAKDVGPKG